MEFILQYFYLKNIFGNIDFIYLRNIFENFILIFIIIICLYIIYLLRINAIMSLTFKKLLIIITNLYLLSFLKVFLVKNVDLSKKFQIYNTFFRPRIPLNRAPFRHYTVYHEPPTDYVFTSTDISLTEPVATLSSEALSSAQTYLSGLDYLAVLDLMLLLWITLKG